jgi:hypothetical protein
LIRSAAVSSSIVHPLKQYIHGPLTSLAVSGSLW